MWINAHGSPHAPGPQQELRCPGVWHSNPVGPRLPRDWADVYLRQNLLLRVTRVDFRGLTKPWLPTLRRTPGVVILVPLACGLIYGLTWPAQCTGLQGRGSLPSGMKAGGAIASVPSWED